ncbi:MAG: ATP-binding protein [Burkholderiales bacterium]
MHGIEGIGDPTIHLDVRSWLEAGGFGQFADLFESRQIDGDALPLLTDAHLKELGVPLGPRVKLLAAITQLAAGAAPDPSAAERRRLTVMFVDLVGSTMLSSRLDPEDMRDLIRAYQHAIAAEVARYDAHVAQYLGDGILVYFGYPRAHEDDAERAVRAALATVRVVAAQRSPAGQPLAARIGIATGLVVVGDLLGEGAAKEHAVVGETPNLAARLLELAAPGEVVVSAQTRALTGNVFELRDLGPQKLKGMPAPVVAYSVLSERSLETRFEAQRGAHLTAMVGRDEELAQLTGRWRRAAMGRGQVVLVTGEAGIGKSRIVRALADALAAEPHVRINNQCSPYHSDSALHPMTQQLVRAAGIGHADGLEVQLDRLEALLEGAGRADIALIAALLGIDGASRYGRLEVTPEQQRARTFRALLNQVVRLSRREPVFWVLEDAHWIDPTTLELLALCLDRAADLPVLAVITARPDFMHDFGDRGHITRMSLSRLGRSQIVAMVSNLAHGKALPEPVLSEIAAKTDGVPLFVEELTKTVLESGILHETDDAFVLDAPLQRLSVPASLHDSMMARLDRHQALKEVAQIAACIGREFGHDLLATIARMPEEALCDALARLEDAELIFRRGAVQEKQYVFKHALVRDAAYESLLKAKRQEIHTRILAALEGAPESAPEILAQHATEAGLVEAAIDHWQKAGALAIARPAYEEAISHVNQALRLADRLPDSRAWQERRLQLLLLLGQATIPLRGYSHSQTVAVFTQAQDLVSAMGDAPNSFSVSYAMWVSCYVRGEHAKAFDVAQSMRLRAQRERSDSCMLTALRALGISQMITGEPVTAHATFAQAQQLAQVLQQQSREHRIAVAHRFAADPEIATQFHVALTLWALGHIDQACELVARTVDAARAMGHAHTLGHALAHGAIFAVVVRDAGGALRLSAETIAFADEHDMDLWRGYGSILSGYALVLAGETARSIPSMESGFRHLARTQTGTMVPAHHAVHAYALATLGRFEEAGREAALVQDELRSGSERYFWPECLRWLGEYLRLVPGGSRAEVESAYTCALSHARKQRAKSWELCAATSLARFWAEQGDRGRAFDLLAPLRAEFTEGGGTQALRDASALLETLR